MRYLVVLNANSAIGAIYLAGNNDGYVVADGEKHPVLDCLEVVTTEPNYLFAKRDLSRQGRSYQALHIPHASVLFIQHFAHTDPNPIGFHFSDVEVSK